MKHKSTYLYKACRLYVEKIPGDEHAKRGDEIRIGKAFFRVVLRVGNWYLLRCLVDWTNPNDKN